MSPKGIGKICVKLHVRSNLTYPLLIETCSSKLDVSSTKSAASVWTQESHGDVPPTRSLAIIMHIDTIGREWKHGTQQVNTMKYAWQTNLKVNDLFWKIFKSKQYHAGQKLDPKFCENHHIFCVSKLKVKYSFLLTKKVYFEDFHVGNLKVNSRCPSSQKTW